MSMMNGRISPQYDDYTSVSLKGSSVVDYIAIPIYFIDNCVTFKVHGVNDLLNKFDLYRLLGEGCEAPDNALLTLEFQTRLRTMGQYSVPSSEGPIETRVRPKYSFDYIPAGFMTSPPWQRVVDELICKIDVMNNYVSECVNLYADLSSQVFTEMNQYLKYTDCNNKHRKGFNNYKPYSSDPLTSAFCDMTESDVAYRRCKHRAKKVCYETPSDITTGLWQIK